MSCFWKGLVNTTCSQLFTGYWDIGTMVYDNVSYDTSADNQVAVSGMCSSENGTDIYICGGLGVVDQYDVEINPYHIDNIIWEQKIDVTADIAGTDLKDIYMTNWHCFLAADENSPRVVVFDLAVSWDVSGMTKSTDLDVSAEVVGSLVGVSINAEKTKLYALDNNANIIYEYDLSIDVATNKYIISYTGIFADVSAHVGVATVNDMFFSAVGRQFFIVTDENIYQFSMENKDSLDNWVYDNKKFDYDQDRYMQALTIRNPEGTTAIVWGDNTNSLLQYSLEQT